MAKAEASVEELVARIERGELRLPEMQRRYIWRATRVRDLLDSLYRGYPSGVILVWETAEQIPLQAMAIEQAKNPYHNSQLLLDGQQRLTSLAAVIRGKPVSVRGHTRPIEILFNLDHPDTLEVFTEVNEEQGSEEEDAGEDYEADSTENDLDQIFKNMTFVVGTKKLARLPQWVSVSDVFASEEDAPFLARAGIEKIADPRYKKFSQRLARLRSIRKYSYRIDVLERDKSYDEVAEIFVRVNSLGAKLRGSDLALAQITAKWRGSLAVFQEFQEQCAGYGYDIDLGILLRSMIAFATGQSRFATVGGLTADQLRSAWAESCRGINFAINLLKSNCDIESPLLLSSPFLIVALAYWGRANKYSIPADLRNWALTANAKGRFSRGSTETVLDQDLASIASGAGPAELMDKLRTQVGRLDVTPEELEGRNQRSAIFKTMFLAFRASGATDWSTNLQIALDHAGAQDKLEFHHIFPKALLKRNGMEQHADDIANLAFIGSQTNKQISDRSPAAYVPEFLAKTDRATFERQCIPLHESLLDVSAYREFLVQRRTLIAKRLNEFMARAQAAGA